MEQLRSIAVKYYSVSSEETQQKVKAFIDGLDKDGNGKVDYYEFKQSLKEQGFKEYANNDLFDKLDKNGDKDLDFLELIALYYIIMSRRPFCYECDRFIMAEYYGCKECFENQSDPVCVCPICYEKGTHYKIHSHGNKKPLFLDTYAMLESQRLAIIESKRVAKLQSERLAGALEKVAKLECERLAALEKNQGHTVTVEEYTPPSSQVIVPYTGGSGGSGMSKALKVALNLVQLKVGLLTLGISSCTIM